MNSPTCSQCDCVKGCSANLSLCPILGAECIASSQVSAAQHRVLDAAIAQPEQQADNFAMTEAHVELLATMMHCVPTERELFKDLNAFCHDARTAVNKAAIAQPVQPAPSKYGSKDMQDLILANLAQPKDKL